MLIVRGFSRSGFVGVATGVLAATACGYQVQAQRPGGSGQADATATPSPSPCAGRYPPPCDVSARWVIRPDRTTSKSWTLVDQKYRSPSVHWPLTVPVDGLVSGLLSVTVNGATVRFRVTDNGKVMQPGAARFPAAPSSESHSYNYSRDEPGRTDCGHLIRVEWRSPTGRPVALSNGQLVVTYQPQPDFTPCPG